MDSLDNYIASHPEHFAKFDDMFDRECERMTKALEADFSECRFERRRKHAALLIIHPSGRRFPVPVEIFDDIGFANNRAIEYAKEVKPRWLSEV